MMLVMRSSCTRAGRFSDKRRMRPAPWNCFPWDSMDAFILTFCRSLKVFYFQPPHWSRKRNQKSADTHVRAFQKTSMQKKCLLFAALAAACLSVHATVLSETFTNDPALDGWQIVGDTNLAQWDSTNHNLQFTWDSAQTNTYFYHLLGTVLTRDDDFSIGFDILLHDIGAGPDPTKAFSFPIAVGFLNLTEATQSTFLRGTGVSSPDLCEFDYFYDSGYGATDWPQFVDTNSAFNYNSSDDYAVYPFNNGEWYHVFMNYTASNQTMVTTVSSVSTNFTVIDPLMPSFSDFRLDTVSISSYNDDQGYGSSVLAHGAVANLTATLPPPPITSFQAGLSNGVWTAQFLSRTNWTYTLQRSSDLKSWNDATTSDGNGGTLSLQDNPNGTMQFYRVRAQRP